MGSYTLIIANGAGELGCHFWGAKDALDCFQSGFVLCLHNHMYYQWPHAPAFERGNVATVVLVQNVAATKAFVS